MAARLKKLHQEDVRAKIQVAGLISILQRNAMGELDPEMSKGRVMSAKILLDKAIANPPSETRISGADGADLTVVIKRLAEDVP